MFNLFKPKRHDPEAIAQAVLTAASEPEIFARFWKEFATSEERCPRVLFSVIIFAYCWTRSWSVGKKDVRVSDAYDRAAEIIALRFKDAKKLVRVSDYVVSDIEISNFYFDLSKHFGQQIPVNVDPKSDAETIINASNEAVRSYQLRFEILARTVMLMRNERMDRQMSDFITSDVKIDHSLMLLSGTLYEQISGVTPVTFSRSPDLLTEELTVSQPRRLAVIEPLLMRLATELKSL